MRVKKFNLWQRRIFHIKYTYYIILMDMAVMSNKLMLLWIPLYFAGSGNSCESRNWLGSCSSCGGLEYGWCSSFRVGYICIWNRGSCGNVSQSWFQKKNEERMRSTNIWTALIISGIVLWSWWKYPSLVSTTCFDSHLTMHKPTNITKGHMSVILQALTLAPLSCLMQKYSNGNLHTDLDLVGDCCSNELWP